MRPLPAALRILLRGCARLAPSRNSRAGRAGAPCGGWRSALSPPAPPSAGARGPERPSPDLALPGRTAPSRTEPHSPLAAGTCGGPCGSPERVRGRWHTLSVGGPQAGGPTRPRLSPCARLPPAASPGPGPGVSARPAAAAALLQASQRRGSAAHPGPATLQLERGYQGSHSWSGFATRPERSELVVETAPGELGTCRYFSPRS